MRCSAHFFSRARSISEIFISPTVQTEAREDSPLSPRLACSVIHTTAQAKAITIYVGPDITIASTPRVFDRDRSEFTDGQPLFLRCSLWRQAGENAAQSLTRGMRVIVTGRLRQRTFDDKEGVRRTSMEIDAEEVAASLTYATAKVTRTYRPAPPSAAAAPTTADAGGDPHPF